MACGAAVAVPDVIAESYVEDGVNALVITADAEHFASRLLSRDDDLTSIGKAARKVAVDDLNNLNVARKVRDQFRSQGIWA